ncbi:MAG: DUF3096 domain-containing protein [Haloechinothrix sp.]
MIDVAIELAQRNADFSFDPSFHGLLALGAGILIFVVPRLLNYIVAGYLVLTGLSILFEVRGF